MNFQRKMRRFNKILHTELGENPLYQWIWSESADFLHPMLKLRDDGSQLYDYKALPSGLITAIPIIETRKIDPNANRTWVMCVRRFPDEEEWIATFGTYHNYPAQGKWIPVDRNQIDPATGRITALGNIRVDEPTEDQTWEFIQMVREFRELDVEDASYDAENAANRRERQFIQNTKDDIKEELGVSSVPGTKQDISFPSVHKKDDSVIITP